LHNFDEIERLDVREGDTVLIERAGEVIPKIVKVITSTRKDNSKKINGPKSCPVCRQNLAKEKEDEVYWYCINPDCPAKIKQSLLHFASRGAMDIEGMGKAWSKDWWSWAGQEPCRYLQIKKADLLKLPLFAQKKADNLILAIEASKKKTNVTFKLRFRYTTHRRKSRTGTGR
jgi:DNA ligase (NAD+)